MMSRRLFNSLERPIGTSSGHNTVWHGYAPYNPRMLEIPDHLPQRTTSLTIFRSVNNFVFAWLRALSEIVGDDGKTPAMRLGFANYPLTYEDILWPGEQIPKRKRRRRKGRTIAAMRQTAA